MLRLTLFCRIAGPCLTGEFADRYGSVKPGPVRFDPDDPELASKLVQARPDSTQARPIVEPGVSMSQSSTYAAAIVSDHHVQPIADPSKLNGDLRC